MMESEFIESVAELPPFSVPATVYHADSPQAVVALLPAMGTAAGFYGRFAQSLVEMGFTVLVPEIPGTGASRPRPSWKADFGYRDLTDRWLPAIVDTARELATGRPVLLFGHSLGAHVAILGVAGGKVAVDGLVSSASGHIHYQNWNGPSAAKVLFAAGLFPALTMCLGHMPGQYFGFGGPQARTLIRQWAKIIFSGSFEHIMPQLRVPESIPSLCIGFEGDRFSPPESVSALAGLLRCETKILPVDWPGNPHSSWARNPSETVKVFGDWSRAAGLTR